MPIIDNNITHRYLAGDDLLRTRTSARREVAAAVADKPERMYVKVGKWPWRRVGGRARVMDAFDRWAKGTKRDWKVGIRKDGRIRTLIAVRHEEVRIVRLPSSSPDTSLAWSLIRHAFPKCEFGGGYVWKQVSGSSSWSDHAWGTAVDATARAQNDAVTSWVARMAKAGLMRFDYALGSRNGQVVYVTGNGDIRPSSASRSHLWHVHLSIVDHDGRKPPRTGGVF